MDETAHEIEAHINRTRERLGSHLKELENKVDAAIDWREHFREKPHLFLGAAVIGAAMLATALRTTSRRRSRADPGVRRFAGGGGSAQAQALEVWNNVKGALIGVATARIKKYVGEFVPDFDDHYRRAEQRAAAPAALDRTY